MPTKMKFHLRPKTKQKRKWTFIFGRKRKQKSPDDISVFFLSFFIHSVTKSVLQCADNTSSSFAFFAVAIDADTILKFGGQTPAQSAGIFFTVPPNLHCAPIPGAQRGHTTVEKNRHCENKTS